MARQAADYDTRTKTARAKLAARPKPYYRQIGPGKTLGYIRREVGVPGKEVEIAGSRAVVADLPFHDLLTR